MQQDADPASWQDILGENVVRLGGAVHPVLFLQKRAGTGANRDSVYRLFHRIELFLRDQTVRYHLPANPGNIIAVKNQYLLVYDIDSRLLGGFADENRA